MKKRLSSVLLALFIMVNCLCFIPQQVSAKPKKLDIKVVSVDHNSLKNIKIKIKNMSDKDIKFISATINNAEISQRFGTDLFHFYIHTTSRAYSNNSTLKPNKTKKLTFKGGTSAQIKSTSSDTYLDIRLKYKKKYYTYRYFILTRKGYWT